MVVKLLGTIDLISSLIVLMQYFTDIKAQIIFGTVLYLLIKGLFTWKNIAGLIDFISGVFLLVVFLMGIKSGFSFIIFILLLQKGIFSFM